MTATSSYTVCVKNLLEISKSVLYGLASLHFRYVLHSQSNTNFSPVNTERDIRLWLSIKYMAQYKVCYIYYLVYKIWTVSPFLLSE